MSKRAWLILSSSLCVAMVSGAQEPPVPAPAPADPGRVLDQSQVDHDHLKRDLDAARQDLDAAAHDLAAVAAATRAVSSAFAASRALLDTAKSLEANTLLTPALFPELHAAVAAARPRAAALQQQAIALQQLLQVTPPSRDLGPRTQELREAIASIVELGRSCEAQLKDAVTGLRTRLRAPSALVVSGGISLGSYQAGFLYYYSQYLLQHSAYASRALGEANLPRSFEIATGASAGSINTFLSVLTACREPVLEPKDSLFYQVWVPLGLGALTREPPPGADADASRLPAAVFTDTAIAEAVEKVRRVLTSPAGWSKEPCAAFMGISATRLRHRSVYLPPIQQSVAWQAEKFILGIHGRGGEPPHFEALRPSLAADSRELAKLYSVPGQGDEITVADLVDLLRASSAFPLAFSPRELHFRTLGATSPGDADSAYFVDGGVFDNTPLGLAARMDRWLNPTDSTTRYLFVDPGVRGWSRPAAAPGPTPPSPPPKPEDVIDVYEPFVWDFVQSAEGATLVESLQSQARELRTLEVPKRQLPLASEHLGHFFGFFEQPFRQVDFYVGMLDAWQHLTLASPQFKHLPPESVLAIDDDVFACLLAERRAELAGRAATAAPPRLCGRLDAGEARIVQLYRIARAQREWGMGPEYVEGTDFDHFLTLLQNDHYEFQDLHFRGSVATPQTVRRAIRDVIDGRIEYLADSQRTLRARAIVKVAGKAAANYFEYVPPRRSAYFGMSSDRGIDLGADLSLWPEWIRGQGGLRIYQLERAHPDPALGEKTMWTLEPYGHLLATVPALSNATIQTSLGAGWVFRLRGGDTELVYYRTGPEAVLGFSLLERLFLDFHLTYFVDHCPANNHCSQVQGHYQESSLPLLTYHWSMGANVGWRWLP